MEKFNTLLYISYNSSFLNCKESEQKKRIQAQLLILR